MLEGNKHAYVGPPAKKQIFPFGFLLFGASMNWIIPTLFGENIFSYSLHRFQTHPERMFYQLPENPLTHSK
jgi:hypothetical protein